MRPQFTHRPDGLIIISDGTGVLTAPLDWFTAQTGYSPDVAERQYYPGDRHYVVDLGGQVVEAPLTWPEGDGYLAQIANYQATWDELNTPEPPDSIEEPLPPPPTLESVKDAKMSELDENCQVAITSGFASMALGSPHAYSSEREDQINLIGSLQMATITDADVAYVCTDLSTGIKMARIHTPAQMLQVFQDGAIMKQNNIYCFHVLRAYVEAAATIAEVEAIAWVCPVP